MLNVMHVLKPQERLMCPLLSSLQYLVLAFHHKSGSLLDTYRFYNLYRVDFLKSVPIPLCVWPSSSYKTVPFGMEKCITISIIAGVSRTLFFETPLCEQSQPTCRFLTPSTIGWF